MKISFWGAAKTVTGSCFLVETNKKNFIVDCGLFQGNGKEVTLNLEKFPFDVSTIDFVLLTHAHIDHSGKIPKLYKEGYRNQIITTEKTFELCKIMLPDSGYIQETEAETVNKRRSRQGKHLIEPLYKYQDAIDSLQLFNTVKYDEIIEIDNVKIRFLEAGHMLGSAMIEVWIRENGQEEKIVFTGDLGQKNQSIIRNRNIITETDYLVMESTYGGRNHEDNVDKAKRFINIVEETLEQGGNVIIPSFAVGRTQEILYEIFKYRMTAHDDEYNTKVDKVLKVPVYVDSPLAVSATEVFKNSIDYYDPETLKYIQEGKMPLEFPGLKLTRTVDESKALNESAEQAIILSSSGMCEAGRIKHHLKHNLWKENSTIIFVGYQAQGTLGRRLVDGAKTVRILGETIKVKARIESIEGFSCHADQLELLNFVGEYEKLKHIFLVHGEIEQQKILYQKIQEKFGYSIEIPDLGDAFDLNTMVHKVAVLPIDNQYKYERLELLDRIETLKEEVEEMIQYINNDLKRSGNEELISAYNQKVSELESSIVDVVKLQEL
ncbi:MAG: MBL fold metallo-hydrolase [Bacilli bacterium]|nr:MBL fold metallo-hydrolase [Clostridia bacterium]